MPKRESKTAAELMRELEADPKWVAARDERERQLRYRAQFYARDEADLVSELQAVGYAVESVWDLVNNEPHPVLNRRFTGPYGNAYPVLVRHLGVSHLPRVREGIVRALSVPDIGELAKAALLEEFQAESDSDLLWVFANALQVSMSAEELAAHPEITAALSQRGS
ncbi:MAG: hypothetical protein GY725_06395 [bacterium]|nr:hypothetical protein [bacterium]